MRAPKNAAGFSLMEIMVVLAILALVTTLAAPAVSRVVPGLQLRAEARHVQMALESAASRAVAARRPVSVSVDLGHAPALLVDGRAVVRIDPKTAIHVTAAHSASSDGTPRLVFYPNGTTTGGRIELSRGRHDIFIATDWLTSHVRTYSARDAKNAHGA